MGGSMILSSKMQDQSSQIDEQEEENPFAKATDFVCEKGCQVVIGGESIDDDQWEQQRNLRAGRQSVMVSSLFDNQF